MGNGKWEMLGMASSAVRNQGRQGDTAVHVEDSSSCNSAPCATEMTIPPPLTLSPLIFSSSPPDPKMTESGKYPPNETRARCRGGLLTRPGVCGLSSPPLVPAHCLTFPALDGCGLRLSSVTTDPDQSRLDGLGYDLGMRSAKFCKVLLDFR